MLTSGGKRYFIIFIGDCSRFIYFYLLRTKNKVFKKFKKIIKIKILKNNRGENTFLEAKNTSCFVINLVHVFIFKYNSQAKQLGRLENWIGFTFGALCSADDWGAGLFWGWYIVFHFVFSIEWLALLVNLFCSSSDCKESSWQDHRRWI